MRLKLFASLLMLLPLTAMAQGDPERGKIIGFTCTGCHGTPFLNNTYPTYYVPRLGGQNEAYLVSSLKAYRSGERHHATMRAQANTLSDQDILDIAAYFASFSRD